MFTGVSIPWKKDSKPRNLDFKTNKNNDSKPENKFRKNTRAKILLTGAKVFVSNIQDT